MKKFCFTLYIAFFVTINQALGAEKGMPQLNSEFWASQIFWLTLIFLGLYGIIWKVFLPKITDSIENRKSRVINDVNEAQKLKESAEKKLEEYNKIIENTKKEAKKILEMNKKKLESEIEKKKQKFNEEIEKELTNIEKEVKNLKKSSVLHINKIAEEIASEVVKKIIGSEVNSSNVSAIVNDISKKSGDMYR